MSKVMLVGIIVEVPCWRHSHDPAHLFARTQVSRRATAQARRNRRRRSHRHEVDSRPPLMAAAQSPKRQMGKVQTAARTCVLVLSLCLLALRKTYAPWNEVTRGSSDKSALG